MAYGNPDKILDKTQIIMNLPGQVLIAFDSAQFFLPAGQDVINRPDPAQGIGVRRKQVTGAALAFIGSGYLNFSQLIEYVEFG